MKKFDVIGITNFKDGNNAEDESNTCIYSKKPNFIFLSEIFPVIPKELFYPVINFSEEEINDLISNLSNMNNLDIREYLSKFSKQPEIELESTSISGSNMPIDKIEIPSLDDDKVLAQLEEENEKCIILGRTFIKEAHKMFSSKFGLEKINIDDIPPEITEMSWKVPESLMLTLYKAFFEEIGFIESETETERIVKNDNTKENLTMREIMELEEAIEKSLQPGKILIQNDQNLSLQISSLVLKYPEISREELQSTFISCNMDIAQTNSQLASIGYKSQDWICNGNERTEKPSSGNKKKKDFTADALRVNRLQQRINQEQNRLKHAQNKLNTIRRHDLHAQVAAYWKDELSQSKQRLLWYQEQMALANAAQQSLVYGNRHLDLHGFTKDLAIVALDNRIEEFRSCNLNLNKGKYLVVICGRGLHSLNGNPRLKPAIRNHLINSGISYSQTFDGTFQIPLKQFLCLK